MDSLRLCFFLFCVGLHSAYGKTEYQTFNTKFNSQQNLSYGLTKPRGLKPEEKQAILDMTNALRNKIAIGQALHSAIGRAPNATNMMAMEWDDILAEFAQKWADTCPEGHSDLKVPNKNYADANIRENLSGGTVLIETDMFGEVRNWDYIRQTCEGADIGNECGHYNTLVSWSMIRLGCGYSACKKNIIDTSIVLVCEFAPFSSAGLFLFPNQTRYKFQYEYYTNLKKGASINPGPEQYAPSEPCSECLQGWDYCMGGGLCATKAECDSDPNNKCVCKNDKKTCEGNGGTFDAENCRCKCPESRMGRNCATKCQNTPHEWACGINCGGAQEEFFKCFKSCYSCGKAVSYPYKVWQEERPPQNKHKMVVRATAFNPDPPIPKDVKTSTLPNRGKTCKNKESDYFCENIRRRNYCWDAVYGPQWRYYCAESCNTCGNKDFQNHNKKVNEYYANVKKGLVTPIPTSKWEKEFLAETNPPGIETYVTETITYAPDYAGSYDGSGDAYGSSGGSSWWDES